MADDNTQPPAAPDPKKTAPPAPAAPRMTHVVTKKVASLHARNHNAPDEAGRAAGKNYKPGEQIPEGALTDELLAHYEERGFLVPLAGS